MTFLRYGFGAAGGYEIEKSLRFRAENSAHLSRTPGVAGNRKTWTWSAWVKRGNFAENVLFSCNAGAPANGHAELVFDTSGTLYFASANDTVSLACIFETTAVFRDPTSHFHVMCVLDTTNAVADDRIRIFINGVRQAGTMDAVPVLNSDQQVNRNIQHVIGHQIYTGYSTWSFGGYLSRICFVDGQALGPESFGYQNVETNTWVTKAQSQCKAVVDAGGVNSFMLDFDNGTSLTTLGYDKSVKGNNWTLNGHSLTAGATYDWMDDTPTNVFATLDPLRNSTVVAYMNPTMSNANLRMATGDTSQRAAKGSINVSSGKWYFEATTDVMSTALSHAVGLYDGVTDTGVSLVYYRPDGVFVGCSPATSGATYAVGDVIGVAFDMSAGSIEFFKNGVSQGGSRAFSAATPERGAFLAVGGVANGAWTINFGQRPFAYAPPAGFKALCTKNLPEPTIKNPKQHFDVILRNGFSPAGGSITGLKFKPDFLWNKSRNTFNNNYLFDSVRGVANILVSNSTAAEYSAPAFLTSFDSNGYTLGIEDHPATTTVVDWLWKAGGPAVTNTAGSITSQVSANTTAGFSIVTYTGTGANATVGHGLGVAPKMVMVKGRDGAEKGWVIQHDALLATEYITYSTGAKATDATMWNSTKASSSVFSIGSNISVNTVTNSFVAYCFAEVPGYSRIGSYIGNGSSDGKFVWCGFRPKWVMIKRADAGTSQWIIHDAAREPINFMTAHIYPHVTNGETISMNTTIDAAASGFKLRTFSSEVNGNGATYIFIAFAEAPFKYANAR